jgi:hypothetical protein
MGLFAKSVTAEMVINNLVTPTSILHSVRFFRMNCETKVRLYVVQRTEPDMKFMG